MAMNPKAWNYRLIGTFEVNEADYQLAIVNCVHKTRNIGALQTGIELKLSTLRTRHSCPIDQGEQWVVG